MAKHNRKPAQAALETETVAPDMVAVETAPVETAPVETAPVETAPVETAPVETAPVETVETVTGFEMATPAPVTAAQATGQRMVNHAVARNFGKTGVAVAGSVIRLLTTANPKRGKSFDRYALHFDGQTIEQYVEAVTKANLGSRALALSDIAWGLAHKFYRIETAIVAPVETVESQPVEADIVAHAVEAAESAIAA